jgi:hypothetical protein
MVELIVIKLDAPLILYTFDGNDTGGTIDELVVSKMTLPGTWGRIAALASITYAIQYIFMKGISLDVLADKNILRSQRPDVKNGWLVKEEIRPAFTPATTVAPADALI